MCSEGMFDLILALFVSIFWDQIVEELSQEAVNFLQDKVPFVSADGIHQLHIFIFILAISHVFYCITTLALGSAKV